MVVTRNGNIIVFGITYTFDMKINTNSSTSLYWIQILKIESLTQAVMGNL